MHFSALAVLACVLVASAAPAPAPGHDDSLISLIAPVTVKDVGNNNDVKALNDVLNGHGKRGLINIFAPITISNILNCNNIEVANDILNGLAAELGCLVAELLITVEDIIGCHDEHSAHALLSKAADNVSHNSKRHGENDGSLLDIFAPARPHRHLAPINISNILNCNNIEIANNILNGLAAELGCLVAELLITVQDILDCHDEASAHHLLSEAAANASKVQKRHDDGLINIYAPINISNILNCNTIEIANNILNGLALELGCLVAELLITVEDIIGCHTKSSAHHLLSEAAANASKVQKRHGGDDGDLLDIFAPVTVEYVLNDNDVEVLNNVANGHGKRGLINIFAPINISNILNCNNIEVANNILNGLAAELGCLVAELLITVQDILGCHDEASAHHLLSEAAANASKVQKRHDDGLINIFAPINVSPTSSTATTSRSRTTSSTAWPLNLGASAHALLSQAAANASKVQKRHDDSAIKVVAPVTVKDVGNNNKVGILNNVL
ncbi:hypothetical protein FIBSPDRAFT_956319 [Athelia psychrophila]|uniref:Uncharacterized protein n=1 Tax=Athelia psychrophila TaxID=1759441 RepID=A0A166GZU1_9AGAM|nr:hypothetical protein FIBSPDRAFT_956319 [Fibularhizoctonia sp. CBS 109695]